MDSKTYKGISAALEATPTGRQGQYAAPAYARRRHDKGKAGFIAQAVKDYKISRVHLTLQTCSFTIYPKTMYVNWQ